MLNSTSVLAETQAGCDDQLAEMTEVSLTATYADPLLLLLDSSGRVIANGRLDRHKSSAIWDTCQVVVQELLTDILGDVLFPTSPNGIGNAGPVVGYQFDD